MTEEEQKAIEELKKEINKPLEMPEDKFNTFILYNIESAKTLLNLISNLQEENRSLKQENDFLKQLYSGTEEFKSIERKYK